MDPAQLSSEEEGPAETISPPRRTTLRKPVSSRPVHPIRCLCQHLILAQHGGGDHTIGRGPQVPPRPSRTGAECPTRSRLERSAGRVKALPLGGAYRRENDSGRPDLSERAQADLGLARAERPIGALQSVRTPQSDLGLPAVRAQSELPLRCAQSDLLGDIPAGYDSPVDASKVWFYSRGVESTLGGQLAEPSGLPARRPIGPVS